MSNHEIVGKGFGILREQLAPYIAQQLMSIPEYKVEDRWWTEGVLGVMNEREQGDLCVLAANGSGGNIPRTSGKQQVSLLALQLRYSLASIKERVARDK